MNIRKLLQRLNTIKEHEDANPTPSTDSSLPEKSSEKVAKEGDLENGTVESDRVLVSLLPTCVDCAEHLLTMTPTR